MDPASATILFFLFLATEKAVTYAGGKVADSMTKPIWEALEEKAKWLAGKDDTAKRWQAFIIAFEETRKHLETQGRHPELAKQIAGILNQFDLKSLPDNQWLDELAIQLEKASLVSEKPDEFLMTELFGRVLPKGTSRAELSESVADFVSFFQDSLFVQPAYKEDVFKNKQWQKMREPRYDTRDRYIEQVIQYHENLDFVGIPELKDRQALRIEDIFITLQTEYEVRHNILNVGELDEDREFVAKKSFRVPALKEAIRRVNIGQALTDNQKIVVLGDPGSGKTTMLKYIILAYGENQIIKLGLIENKLPIFIRLYDYVAKRVECGKDGFSFTDYLQKYCADHLQLHLPPDFFAEALEKGECCVCFDGLDELGAAGIRREITLAVSAMANRYSRNRFIVTSRIVGYDDAPLDKNEFVHHTIQPLSDDDIKLFVEKWYKARERDIVVRRERTDHLVKTIMGEQRIKSLAANPLMLTIIALVHRIEAELPHERVKLYDKCVTTLVETWDKVRGIKTALRRRLLEKLAYWMHSQPGEKGRTREVREGNLRMKLIQFLQADPKLQMDDDQIRNEVENFITLVKTRSGLLVERGEGVYTFSHLTFQEYLAACDIEKRLAHSTDLIWEEIQPKLHNVYWREVHLLLLGTLNRFEEHNSVIVRKIYENPDYLEPVIHHNLFLCAQILSDYIEVDSILSTQIINDLIALTASNEITNENSLTALLSLKRFHQVMLGLLEVAKDKKTDVTIRWVATREILKLAPIGDVINLLLELVRDVDVYNYTRRMAILALYELEKGEEAVRLFLSIVLDNNLEMNARISAIEILGKLGSRDGELLNSLVKLSKDKRIDAGIRLASVESLIMLGYSANEVIVDLLQIGNDVRVKFYYRKSAGILLVSKGFFEGRQLLRSLAEDENLKGEYRKEAVEILMRFGYINDGLELVHMLVRDRNLSSETHEEIMVSLIGFRDEDKAARTLTVLASDNSIDYFLRAIAASGLIKLGRVEEGVRALFTLTENKMISANAYLETANSLLSLGYETQLVANMFASVNNFESLGWYKKEELANLFLKLGLINEAKKLLLDLAVNVSSKVSRQNQVQALIKLGFEDEIKRELFACARKKDVEPIFRINILEVMAELWDVNDLHPILLELASNKEVAESDRFKAVEILIKMKIDNINIVTTLLGIAGDSHLYYYVRYIAADALIKLGHIEEAGELLISLAQDMKNSQSSKEPEERSKEKNVSYLINRSLVELARYQYDQ